MERNEVKNKETLTVKTETEIPLKSTKGRILIYNGQSYFIPLDNEEKVAYQIEDVKSFIEHRAIDVSRIPLTSDNRFEQYEKEVLNIIEPGLGIYPNFKMKSRGKVVPVRTTPKVQNNDPCTCGSGKKFKKCCK